MTGLMELTRENIQHGLIKALILMAYGIVFFQCLKMEAMISLLLAMICVLTALLWVHTMIYSVSMNDILIAVIVLISFINVFISSRSMHLRLSFSSLRKLILFFMTLINMNNMLKADMNDGSIRKLILTTNTALILFLNFIYFKDGTRTYELNGIKSSYLTFYFTNPNLIGLFLGSVIMIENGHLFNSSPRYEKAFHVVLILSVLRFITMTESRNILLTTIIYFFLIFFLVLAGRRIRINTPLAIFFVLFPLLFALIYYAVIDHPSIQRIFSFMISEGKDIDSRIRIWKPAIESITQYPLFGAYYELSNGTGMSQMHNTGLDVLSSYGMPVYILTVLFQVRVLMNINRNVDTTETSAYMLGFICCLIAGIGEAALFSGGLSYFVFVSFFIILCRCKTVKKDVAL